MKGKPGIWEKNTLRKRIERQEKCAKETTKKRKRTDQKHSEDEKIIQELKIENAKKRRKTIPTKAPMFIPYTKNGEIAKEFRRMSSRC